MLPFSRLRCSLASRRVFSTLIFVGSTKQQPRFSPGYRFAGKISLMIWFPLRVRLTSFSILCLGRGMPHMTRTSGGLVLSHSSSSCLCCNCALAAARGDDRGGIYLYFVQSWVPIKQYASALRGTQAFNRAPLAATSRHLLLHNPTFRHWNGMRSLVVLRVMRFVEPELYLAFRRPRVAHPHHRVHRGQDAKKSSPLKAEVVAEAAPKNHRGTICEKSQPFRLHSMIRLRRGQ